MQKQVLMQLPIEAHVRHKVAVARKVLDFFLQISLSQQCELHRLTSPFSNNAHSCSDQMWLVSWFYLTAVARGAVWCFSHGSALQNLRKINVIIYVLAAWKAFEPKIIRATVWARESQVAWRCRGVQVQRRLPECSCQVVDWSSEMDIYESVLWRVNRLYFRI